MSKITDAGSALEREGEFGTRVWLCVVLKMFIFLLFDDVSYGGEKSKTD